jgi:hypothetical protein
MASYDIQFQKGLSLREFNGVPPVGVREAITNLCRAGFRRPVGVAGPAQQGLTGRFLMCSKVVLLIAHSTGSQVGVVWGNPGHEAL